MEEPIMKKFVCSVCGYVYEGEQAPEFCPQCKAPREKFIEKKEGASFGISKPTFSKSST